MALGNKERHTDNTCSTAALPNRCYNSLCSSTDCDDACPPRKVTFSNNLCTVLFYAFAESSQSPCPTATFQRHEGDKRRAYEECVREVEQGSFTPLVFGLPQIPIDALPPFLVTSGILHIP